MAQLVGNDEIQSLRVELAEIGRSLIWGHRFSAIALVSEAFQDCAKLPGLKSQEAKITIIDDVSGIIKPGRCVRSSVLSFFTKGLFRSLGIPNLHYLILLLIFAAGQLCFLVPPGCRKTTLLKALSGKLSKSLKVAGEVSYNGYKLKEFIPQKTSVYISQNDLHIPEMTVRETLDFSARCQGIGSRAEIMIEVSRREKQSGIVPDPDADIYMKILGLDICAYTLIGDAMRRGISGGQKKRLTTAAPDTFDLFDDIIMMAEGKIVYHGPCSHVLEFFEDCGFRCFERIGVADFLQEVISKKDQAQYCTKPNNLAITFLLTCFPRNSSNRLLLVIIAPSIIILCSLLSLHLSQ
ncbi:hypothetical protein ACSBR2_018430 [Camellia fascicularis]